MNLNKKIKKFTGDGIPAYNAKIDELIDAATWLLGLRVINGKPVTESDQGPVIDLSQFNTTQSGPAPWATDPDGNPTGWSKVLVLDINYVQNHQMFTMWIWTGGNEQTVSIPWMSDPDGVQAQWVQHDVCVGGSVVSKWFWGTP